MKKLFLFTTILFLLTFLELSAQINMPRPSPGATVMQKVGLADVTVAYSRPSLKGRKAFGEVVPFDKIWRTGANEPTKLSITDTVTIEGKKLAPGDYALYTIPGMTEWTIIIGKNPKTAAGSYKDEEEAARFKVKAEKLCASVETFTIGFSNVTTNAADLVLTWETTAVKFNISTEVDSKVMAQIKSKMEDTQLYYSAASYYYDTNRDMKQALEWINKATEKDPKFWMMHTKAKIQARLKDCKGATESANKSMEMAKAAKNDEYVKFNEKLIAECKGK
jgi:hypothetical protein